MRTISRLAVLALLGSGLALAGPPASAGDVIHVWPGQKDAIQKAENQAGPGDTLLIHAGRYPVSGPNIDNDGLFVDTRNLTLEAAGDGPVIVAGRCQTFRTITIAANSVTLQGLRIRGGDYFDVDVGEHRNTELRRLRLWDSCGDAYYGINLYQSGQTWVDGNRAVGYEDAGIYVGDIPTVDEGGIRVRNNVTFGNHRGIIIEDARPGTVRVVDNLARDNDVPELGLGPPVGIILNRTDGLVVRDNVVRDNGAHGIRVTQFNTADRSSGNKLFDNTISGSGDLDVLDEGLANCWNGTTYDTADPNPPPICPVT